MKGVKQCMKEPIELITNIKKANSVNILERKTYLVRFFNKIKTIVTIVARYRKMEARMARCIGAGSKKIARSMRGIPIIIYKPIETRITHTGGAQVIFLNWRTV